MKLKVLLLVGSLLILSSCSTIKPTTTISIGIDPKIAIVGTDNQHTNHDQTFNWQVKLERTTFNRIHYQIGLEYANLQEWYLAYYIGSGYSFGNKFKVIPSIEAGSIIRQNKPFNNLDKRSSPNSLYAGLNLNTRWFLFDSFKTKHQTLKNIAIDTGIYKDLATDLPNRFTRWGCSAAIVIILN